jgi:hypothetical protein
MGRLHYIEELRYIVTKRDIHLRSQRRTRSVVWSRQGRRRQKSDYQRVPLLVSTRRARKFRGDRRVITDTVEKRDEKEHVDSFMFHSFHG